MLPSKPFKAITNYQPTKKILNLETSMLNSLTKDSTKETTTAATALLLLVLSSQGIGQRTKTKPGQDLLDTETTE